MFRFFENLIDPFPAAPPTPPPARLAAFCWHYSRDIWPYLALMTALVALIAGLEVLMFSFVGDIVDWLAGARVETFWADEWPRLAWMGAVILLLQPGLSFLHSLIMHQTVIGNYPMIIRWRAHRYVLGQSYEFFQDEFAGRVATKVMQAALAVREVAMKILDVLVYVGTYFLGALLLLATFDPWLVAPFALWLVGYGALLRYFLPRLSEISARQSHARSTMTGRVVDSYTNILTVKLFTHAGRESAYARSSMEQFLATVHPQMRLVTMLHSLLNFLNGLLLFSVGAVAVVLWQHAVMAPGAVAVALGLVLRLSGLSHWIMWEMAGLFEHIGMAYDSMKMLSKPRRVRDRDAAPALAVERGEVRFDEVSFHYGKASGVIDRLSLTVRPGEKLGLVGRSGAGKTTLMNLLLRLYDLQGGRILIDGQEIAAVSQDSLRAQIGVVTQDTSLLHRSVRENIAYGAGVDGADDAAVIAAAKRASAHEFILELEDSQGRRGYDAQVGERGVKLSGGQRQRIAIARIFLKNAPILLLDEATSALDSEVELAIQENLDALMRGKTVIAIAHRLSTIAALDRLVVLDRGRIVEQGDHDRLSRAGGLYAELWAHQSGGFIGDAMTLPSSA